MKQGAQAPNFIDPHFAQTAIVMLDPLAPRTDRRLMLRSP
jgi:hypothetical protein